MYSQAGAWSPDRAVVSLAIYFYYAHVAFLQRFACLGTESRGDGNWPACILTEYCGIMTGQRANQALPRLRRPW